MRHSAERPQAAQVQPKDLEGRHLQRAESGEAAVSGVLRRVGEIWVELLVLPHLRQCCPPYFIIQPPYDDKLHPMMMDDLIPLMDQV